MVDTSFTELSNSHLDSTGFRVRPIAIVCLLGILSVPALAEKGSPQTEWMATLARGPREFAQFEVWTETWRYEIFDSTAPISIARSEEWIDSLRNRIAQSATGEQEPKEGFSIMVEEARRFFASPPEYADVLSEVHQRDSATASYWVWERRTGDLSKFERQGTWHQSDGVVAIGPALSNEDIEMFLAQLGVLIPEQAKALEVPSSTPEFSGKVLTLQVDQGETRLRMGAQPWKGILGPRYTEKFPLVDQEEEALSEKRHFFRFKKNGDIGSATGAFPDAAVEFRYDPDGDLISYALIQIHPPELDPDRWRPFPSARPPFGWTVLDYRFLPEKEYIFGDTQ
ncbi:MAG: hypothetical protein KC931_01615 [Candidatus Omnitrophica bacterium]|nr:hypothetical protein [Candidatus Omnitrophota bacterium]MCA9445783.1 hypothetical protein [Candidatus Omnitrophota bacterium]